MSSTAADMPGPLHITLIVALLASCDAFRLGSSQRVIPLSPPEAHLFQDEGPAQPHFIQELVRTKRHSVPELVRAQPHLVHDMGWPEIHETSRSQASVDSLNSSHLPSAVGQDVARTHPAVDENMAVEDEMERMVHLAVPQDEESYRRHSDNTDTEKELLGESLEASGFYGKDLEDRDRAEDGGEDRERREDEWERDTGEDRERKEEDERGAGDLDDLDVFDANHTTPDLGSLIGYSPSFHPLSSQQASLSPPVEGHDSGLQEHRASTVLELGPSEREAWEAVGQEDGHSSGYGVPQSSLTTSSTTSSPVTVAGGDTVGTATPETDTGTDFGLLGSYTKDETEDEETKRMEEEDETGLGLKDVFTQNPTVADVGMAPSREPLQPSVEEELEQEEHHFKDPSSTMGFSNPAVDSLEKTTPLPDQRSEVRGGGVTEVLLTDSDFDEMDEARQVKCLDWSKLAGGGYVILNMTQNLNCEEFRADQGVRLLKIMEQVFARRMNSPEGSWVLYLSKPTHQQHQLLMNVESEHAVIGTQDVLAMLGEIRKSLNKVGIQNYSAPSGCQPRPSQTRGDYGKLFVVLVIIGSVCMVIITSGFIYICWQRRLPATKTTFRAEELHFVENGCHDNPMLDVANDGQPEMREKKPSTNGLSGGGGEGGGEDNNRWQVFVNQAVTEEEEEEQDTHL